MGNLIKVNFGRKISARNGKLVESRAPTRPTAESEEEFDVRMERIKTSLHKINELMCKLRQEGKED